MANKQGSNKEANIRAYYGEVNKFGQNGEYDKAIKSLNKSKCRELSLDCWIGLESGQQLSLWWDWNVINYFLVLRL